MLRLVLQGLRTTHTCDCIACMRLSLPDKYRRTIRRKICLYEEMLFIIGILTDARFKLCMENWGKIGKFYELPGGGEFCSQSRTFLLML